MDADFTSDLGHPHYVSIITVGVSDNCASNHIHGMRARVVAALEDPGDRHKSQRAKVMRADYDSEGDTVQIELEPVRNAGRAEDVENGAVIVSIHDYRWGDPPASFTRMGHRAPHRGAPQGG